jgi:hypothetical protein
MSFTSIGLLWKSSVRYYLHAVSHSRLRRLCDAVMLWWYVVQRLRERLRSKTARQREGFAFAGLMQQLYHACDDRTAPLCGELLSASLGKVPAV